MKKFGKIFLSVIMSALFVFALTACGNIDIKDLEGKWTIKTIDGKTPEEYAAKIGGKVEKSLMNLSIEDKKLTVTWVYGVKDYEIDVRKDGFEAVDNNKSVQGYLYDKKSGKFSTNIDFGNGPVEVVFKKGSADIEIIEETTEDEYEDYFEE